MKNKLFYYLGILLLAVVAFSCNGSQRTSFSDFPATLSPESGLIELEEPYIHGRLLVYDTLVFLTSTPQNPYQVHVYTEDFRYIKSAGLTGSGPGEITNPFFAAIDEDQQILWFMDLGKRVFHKFQIDSLLNDELYFPRKNIPVPDDKFVIIQYFPLDNTVFSYSDFNVSPPMISFFDEENPKIDSLIIPDGIVEGFHHNQGNAFLNSFVYHHHPAKEKMVLANRFSDVIAIIDHDGKVLSYRQGPDMITQVPDHTKQNQISTYESLQVDESFIYALYFGDTTLNENQELIAPKSIHIFNWEGEPVARIKLDHHLTSFTLDRKNKRLLGFCMEMGSIAEYSLKDFYAEYQVN